METRTPRPYFCLLPYYFGSIFYMYIVVFLFLFVVFFWLVNYCNNIIFILRFLYWRNILTYLLKNKIQKHQWCYGHDCFCILFLYFLGRALMLGA